MTSRKSKADAVARAADSLSVARAYLDDLDALFAAIENADQETARRLAKIGRYLAIDWQQCIELNIAELQGGDQ